VELLEDNHIAYKLEIGGQSIGRRYARSDEIGIPIAITVDFQTLEDQCVTLRDRDSMVQHRVQVWVSLLVVRSNARSLGALLTRHLGTMVPDCVAAKHFATSPRKSY
jgi:glycyl-tRNA synthetase (class II)